MRIRHRRRVKTSVDIDFLCRNRLLFKQVTSRVSCGNGIRHVKHSRESSSSSRRGPSCKILLVNQSHVPEKDVHIYEPRQSLESGTVNRLNAAIRYIESYSFDATLIDENDTSSKPVSIP